MGVAAVCAALGCAYGRADDKERRRGDLRVLRWLEIQIAHFELGRRRSCNISDKLVLR